jgi:Outer membrane efflux protein
MGTYSKMTMKLTIEMTMEMIMKKLKLLQMPIFLLVATQATAGTLTVQSFLDQVRAGNDSYKSSLSTGEAAPNKAADAEMVFAPTVFASIQSAVDKKEMKPASQRGNETDYNSGQFGISKMSSFGTAAKIYYNGSQTTIHGTSPNFVPQPSYRETSPTIELSHPLWKNANGRDLAKSIAIEQGKAQIIGLTESLKRKVSLVEAEGYYWRLVLARESLRVAKENLDRANKIIKWNRSRVINQLADSADLIQAEALGEVREIEVTMATDEEKAASHALNTARGVASSEVTDELTKITPELIARLPVPLRVAEREDLRASIQAENLSEIGADLASAKYSPSLDVVASGALNGRDVDSYTKANAESIKGKHASYMVGLKFSAPLGGESLSRLRAGFNKDKEAATLMVARKRYENDREWTDLSRRLDETRRRLTLTQRIEVTQMRKLAAERERQKRGRSTMFQVLQSESDYAASQLNVIRNKGQILEIFARMKTFGGEG